MFVFESTIEQYQEGYSIPAQISILRDYAKMNKYNIIKIYQDAGISGKNIKDRPAMCELIEDAKQNKFDTVLVWKLSRLSRSLLDLLSIVDIFTQNSISFQSYSEKFDTSTPMGKMLLQMLGSIAEFERNTIAENVKMGLQERFKQGYSKGAVPFGYRHENKQAVIIPELADTVKWIFDTYLNGSSDALTYIAKKLNADGYRTRTGGLWSRIAIRDMLQNPFYAGYVRTGIHSHGFKISDNAEIAQGTHEPIIDKELFNKVNEKLQLLKRNNIIRYPDNECILTGLIECPHCGKRLFALNSTNRHKKKNGEISEYPVRVYRCNNTMCKGYYVTANKIQPKVIKELAKYINKEKYVKYAEKISKKVPAQDNKELKLIESELKQAYALRDKYFKLFETGNVDVNMFADKINNIFSDINELEKKKALLSEHKTDKIINFESLCDTLTDFYGLYDDLPNRDKKEFLRLYLELVHITPENQVKCIDLTNGDSIKLLS